VIAIDTSVLVDYIGGSGAAAESAITATRASFRDYFKGLKVIVPQA
jgi:hypothetical protein